MDDAWAPNRPSHGSRRLARPGIGTSNGAGELGILTEVGALDVGRAADILVLGGELTSDLSNVRALRYVGVGGRLYEPGQLRRRR